MHKKLTRRFSELNRHRDGGFTLVELLVITVMIGILAGIAIPVFLNQKAKGVDGTVRADIANAAIQIETYNTDNSTSKASYSSGAALAAINALVAVSSGNTLKVIGDPTDGYCIQGYDPAGLTATSSASSFWYVSQGGGLQNLAGGQPSACAPSFFPNSTPTAALSSPLS